MTINSLHVDSLSPLSLSLSLSTSVSILFRRGVRSFETETKLCASVFRSHLSLNFLDVDFRSLNAEKV